MASSNLQILRSYSNTAPTKLLDGQLAYSFASNTLYIGNSTNGIFTIGGVTPLLTSQYAFNAANSAGSFANVAFTQANVALSAAQGSAPYSYANAAFANANSAYTQASLAYAAANAAGASATVNAAFLQANSAYAQANAAYNSANNVAPQIQPAFNTANGAFSQANLAFAAANAAGSSATVNAAFLTANSAFTAANAAWATANSAANSAYPSAAFAQANASYTAQNTTAGFANSAGSFANGAFVRANAAFSAANVGNTFVNTGGTISGPVTVSANLTVTGNLIVLGNLTSINTTQVETNEPLLFLANNNYTSDIVDIGFVGNYNAGSNAFTGLFRNPTLKEFIFFQNYASPIGSNNLINISDPSFAYANVYANTFKGNVLSHNVDLFYYSNSAYNLANTLSAQTSLAYAQANFAYSQANAAYNAANSGSSATAAFNQANLAYSQANSAFANANSALYYQTSIANNVNSIAVGGAPVQNAQTWSTFTVSQVFDAILFPTTGPTYTIPAIALSASASGTVEVGSTVTQTMTLTGTKNDAGPYVALYIQRNSANIATVSNPSGTATGNIAAQYGYSDPNNQNYYYTLSNTDTVVATTGTFTWAGYGNYTAGQAKLNNKGQTDANSAQVRSTVYPQAAASAFGTGSYSVSGIYPYFWGVSSTQPTASSIASAIQAGTANKVLAVGSGTLTITFNASAQYVWLAVQTGYANKTTWYNTALNNGSIGAGQFILSPVSQAVTSPTSLWSGINYNIYISGYSTTTSGSIQFS